MELRGVAGRVVAQVALAVGPARAPAGAQQDDRALPGRPVLRSPTPATSARQAIVRVRRRLALTSITTAGAISCRTGISVGRAPPSAKWMGASRCVPPCSGVQKRVGGVEPAARWSCPWRAC